MKKEVYTTLIKYLTEWQYPDHYTPKRRKALRHLARGFSVPDGKLYKKATKECPGKRLVVSQEEEVLKVLRENHDHILSGHLSIYELLFNELKLSSTGRAIMIQLAHMYNRALFVKGLDSTMLRSPCTSWRTEQ